MIEIVSSKSVEVIRNEDLPKIEQSLEEYQDQADGLNIVSEETESAAIDFIKPLKDFAKDLDKQRKDFIKGAQDYVKTVNGLFNPKITQLKKIEQKVKDKLTDYRRKLEDAARKEQAKRDEANRKKAEAHNRRVEKEREKAEAQGREERFVPPPLLQEDVKLETTSRGNDGSVTYRKVKRWRVKDEQQIPRQFWLLDEKKIGAAVRSGIEIPGIEIYEDKELAIR